MNIDTISSLLREYIGKDFSDIKASELQSALEDFFRNANYKVEREVWVNDRGDGRRGRVDIVLYKDGARTGIEIDRATPRKKSIVKLHQLKTSYRYVITRSPFKIIPV